MDFEKLIINAKGYDTLVKDKASSKDSEIQELLRVVQAPWNTQPVQHKICEGYLYKKRRTKAGWKLMWFVLSGNLLHYYKNERSKKPMGVLSIAFISPLLDVDEQQLLYMKTYSISKKKIEIYSVNRLDTVCARSDEDMLHWVGIFQRILKEHLPSDGYEGRARAVHKLVPLMEKKTQSDIKKIQAILSELEITGLSASRMKKLKSGNLDMLVDVEDDESDDSPLPFDSNPSRSRSPLVSTSPTPIPAPASSSSPSASPVVSPIIPRAPLVSSTSSFSMHPDDAGSSSSSHPADEVPSAWQKYYFVLSGEVVYYYKTTKSPPKGVITLKYTHVDRHQDDATQFRLVTPISVFVLRAKHEIAASDWIEAIMTVKNGGVPRASSGDGEKDDLLSGDQSEFADLKQISLIHESEYIGFGKKFNAQITVFPEAVEPKDEKERKKQKKLKPRIIKLPVGSHILGRSDSSAVKLDDRKVSRSHAKIEVSEAHALLLDLGSGHGTRVNKGTISKHILQHGDKIKLGSTRVLFEIVKK